MSIFQTRQNALRLRYQRSLIAAQKRRLANLARLSRITGEPQQIPPHLLHLRHGAGL